MMTGLTSFEKKKKIPTLNNLLPHIGTYLTNICLLCFCVGSQY